MADPALPATSARSSDLRRAWPLVLMGASGFAGLGYQVVWTQQGALWLGHESAAVLAVVAGFFAGLAVGALGLGARIERSRQPVRWYAACEAVIAAWSFLLLFAMAPFSDRMLALIGARPDAAWQWTVAFIGTFAVLLPATAAMGATLPAIERVVATMAGARRSIASLYAANTFGATVGVLCAAFWLVPAFGLRGTAMVCIVLNGGCAAGAWMLVPGRAAASSSAATGPTGTSSRRRLTILLAATGLLGIGYEVLVVRVLSQVCEDTVYTFAMLLAVYLLGTAGGAALHRRGLLPRGGEHMSAHAVTDRLLSRLAAACLFGTACLWFSESIRALVVELLGDGLGAALGAEATLAVVAFALPTCMMGALFSHLAASAHRAGLPFGRSLGINIVGAACAPLVFGVLLAPLLGAKSSLLLIVVGELTLVSRAGWASRSAWLPAGFALAVAIGAPPLAFVDVPEGGRIVSYREGVLAAVSVVEDAEGVSRLRIDNRQQEGSSATALVDGRQAVLPLLLHPAPHRALFLGLGTGVTASTAAAMAGVEVDAVELLPEVIASSSHFTPDAPGSRLHLLQADARRYVRTSRTRYDVIVADNFHPARSGSGSLYTTEHFAAVRDRLADDGLFCQWLPLHQLDLDTSRSIVRSFRTAFPEGWAMLANNSLGTPVIGLVGRRDGRRFDVDAISERLARSGLAGGPAAFGIDDVYALLGSFVAGPEALRRFAGDAPLNTDDHPVVAYRAPRFTYAPGSDAQDRLVTLLGEWSIEPGALLTPSHAADVDHRLAAYWVARRAFIEAGRGVRPSADVRAMLAQVRDPLLAVLRTSPDFRPAYDPLLRMADALGRTDREDALALLRELMRMQPGRPEAMQLLRQLDTGTAG